MKQNRYQTAFDVFVSFKDIILKFKQQNHLFDTIIEHMKTDFCFMELKIFLVSNMLDILTPNQANDLIIATEHILETPDQLFRCNLNPIRTALNLFNLTHNIYLKFDYSQFTVQRIKEKIAGALVKVIDSYREPNDIIGLIETHDFYGNDCFYYIQKFELN